MKSRSLAALSVSVVFAISGIPAYAGEAEADPFGKYEETRWNISKVRTS